MTTMNADTMLAAVAKMGGKVRLMGAVMVVLGLLACYAPQMTGMTVSVIVGVLLVIGGILRTSFAWLATGWGSLFLRLAVGILSISAGGYMIMNPGEGAQALSMVLVIYLLVDGITSLVFAFRLPPAAGGIWVILGAVGSLLVAILMWTNWPAAGELAIGVLIGIKLILDGITLIGVGSAARSAANRAA